jgi:HrpA-like RNA helicase
VILGKQSQSDIPTPVDENEDIFKAVVEKSLLILQDKEVSAGDILCLLTGQDEVERAKVAFEENEKKLKGSGKSALVLTAYGKQSAEEQQELFRPASTPNTRKNIFATDVVETSIAIDGIRFVVDSGLKKI